MCVCKYICVSVRVCVEWHVCVYESMRRVWKSIHSTPTNLLDNIGRHLRRSYTRYAYILHAQGREILKQNIREFAKATGDAARAFKLIESIVNNQDFTAVRQHATQNLVAQFVAVFRRAHDHV